jgi:serine/threonine-protein kinase
MSVDLTRWPDADAILDEALALPEPARPEYLQQAVSDPQLRAALDAVLAEARTDDEFLKPAGAWSGPLGEQLRESFTDEPLAVPAGARIEHYEVLGPIGRGGMGEVYRARDGKLGREVALKVLPTRYARDAERRTRFQREARVLASLNHPGIAAIYGVAEAEGVEALVLELVEGPTLAELIAERPRTMDEVLAVSLQLVDAIAEAHDRGILHRDLKPANIKVTPAGTVKILDFGLARALGDGGDGAAAAELTRHSANVLIGTASYMSPEQARGGRVDERSDIWAFGCVLFEMLTGRRAFAGATAADALAAVIQREPAFSLLPPLTPEPLRRLLRRCLDKDPQRRLGYIGDARLDLEDAKGAPPLSDLPPDAAGSSMSSMSFQRPRLLSAAVVVLAALAGVALTAGYLRGRAPVAAPMARLAMPLPTGDRPVTGFQPMPAVSPDGRIVVYRAFRGNTTQLFRRDLDALEPVPIAGTEGGSSPFFSPNGDWLAFDADGVLKRVALSGGSPIEITATPGGVTAAWLSDDTIVFATNTRRVLERVPAAGGTPQPLTTLDQSRGDTLHLLPREVPGGRAVLFTVVAGAVRHIAALDLRTGAVRIVAEGSHATFIAPDAIVFARGGSLWGSRFSAERLEVVGTAMPIEERIAHSDNTVFHYAAAGGSMVYLPPQPASGRQRLVWRDRSGHETAVNIAPRPFIRVSLSPDNQKLALTLEEDGNQDVWVADPGRDTMSRLTFEPTIETMPTFSPDGRHVAFRSEREGPGVFRRDAQGTGTAERLTITDGPIHSPYSWTPDGRSLLVAVFHSFRHQAIGIATPPDTRVRILLDGNFAQLDPQVSPDGRWLAYQSDETGRFEIYVRPFPDVDGGRWLISNAGGTSPRWSPDGRELFYFDGTALVGVPLGAGTSFSPGQPARLFAVAPFGGRLGPDFEVSSDGQRFLFLLPVPDEQPRTTALVFVQNWVPALQSRLATQR